jgi:NADP-dependent 3-hydroxy acid dehydrogenase YdfG
MSKVVVITGASAGVGRAAARAFGARGDAVALLARGRAGLAAAATEVEAVGGRALPIALDVADADAVKGAAERIERELGEIDVWVNAAMTAVLAEVMETTPAEFRRVTEVTYLGSVNGALAALERMVPRNRGVIVQVGSALAYRGIPLQATYCAAKHAVEGFVESLRTELLHRKSKVRLTIVQLPGLNTTQFSWVRARTRNTPMPVPPVYQPEVAADAIVWASEHKRRELWVGQPTAKTIIGNRLSPALVDRYLARTGFDSQQTDQRLDPRRPDYLFEPLDDEVDHGYRGAFDAVAKARSPGLWTAMRRGPLVGGALAAAAGAAAGLGLFRRARHG